MIERFAYHVVGGYISFLLFLAKVLLKSSEKLNAKHIEWEDRLYPDT